MQTKEFYLILNYLIKIVLTDDSSPKKNPQLPLKQLQSQLMNTHLNSQGDLFLDDETSGRPVARSLFRENINHSLIRNNRESVNDEDQHECLLNVTARVLKHGFVAQEFDVETEDGYVLGMQRIGRGKAKGPPVLLMHGLFMNSGTWLDAGPGAGLAYLLARDYDLWLGNVRGSHYSRRHATLDPDSSSAYWQFSINEIGKYDLPAMIDKVLNETGARKVKYIGYSQNCLTYFIMCSERSEYCDKASVMIALAPSGRHILTKSRVLRLMMDFYEKNEQVLLEAKIYEVLRKGGEIQQTYYFLCQLANLGAKLCELVINTIDNNHDGSVTGKTLRNIAANFPSGTSVHNMAHYGQIFKSKTVDKFDYGPDENLKLYGRKKPPSYNFSSVSVPVAVIYGRNDALVDIGDVKWLLRKLPNVVAFEVQDPLWNHLDVTYSRHVPKLLYPKIQEYLSAVE